MENEQLNHNIGNSFGANQFSIPLEMNNEQACLYFDVAQFMKFPLLLLYFKFLKWWEVGDVLNSLSIYVFKYKPSTRYTFSI